VRKPLKVFAVIFAMSILLIGVALGILSIVIDPNQFKPQLAETIKQKIGREVEFAGDLHWSVFPWLGVSAGPMRIRNVQGFPQADFLGIEQGEVKVKVLPLLVKRLEISRIALKGLRLNLLRNKEGANNWGPMDSTSGAAVEPTPPGQAAPDKPVSPEKAWAIFAVGGVDLEEAAIHWDDQQNGQRLDVENINLNVGKLTWDQFADVALTFTVVEPGSGYQDRIGFKTRVLIKQHLEQANLADTELSLAREGEARPAKAISVMLTAPEILFEKNGQKLQIAKLQIESGELAIVSSLSGSHVFEAADVEGRLEMAELNPGKLLKRFDIALPKFQDPGALSRLQAGFNWHVAQNALSLDALRCKLDDTLLQGEARIEGWEAPAIRFNLAVDAVDVGRYLPKNKTPQVTPSAALVGALSKLPVGQLRKLDAQGELTLGHLQMRGIAADDLRLQLKAKEGVIQTRQNISRLHRGGYAGSVNFNAAGRENTMSLAEKVERVEIEPFLKAMGSKIHISGALTASAALRAQGNDSKQIRQGAKGKLTFTLKDGAIRELKFQQLIDQAADVLNHAPPSPMHHNGMDFSEISGTAALAESVIKSQDLLVKSPRFRMEGGGSTHIETGRIDYRFVSHLVKAPATETEPEKLHSTPIVVAMSGTWAEPVYRLDMEALLTEKNKAKIEKFIEKNKSKIDKLKNKLDKKLGPGVDDLFRKLF